MRDEFFIQRTLKLAARAKGRTSPNPMVGALIVKNGNIISEGFHEKAGSPHAEIIAIDKAGKNARGSSLYVSLEPCCHNDKRTPPCTQKIISSGISKVVVAMVDPNPKVSGKGISVLKGSGIEVVSGILEEKAIELNEFYIKHIKTGMPFVIMKTAMTLDGKIATPEGQSKWITGEASRKMVHQIRSNVDAVMTAIGTVKADDPSLTARIRGGKDPIKIVIDPDLETPLNAKILKSPAETMIVTRTKNDKANNLLLSGTNMLYYNDKLELNWLMKRLGEAGIMSVLLEGGSSLNAYALRDGIVDKIMVFVAPKMIGGKNSFTSVGGDFFRRLEDAYQVEGMKFKRIGEDILIEGYIRK